MSALEDYADIIARRRAYGGYRTEAETVMLALADELESLRNDGALGRLVRQMKNGWALQCYGMGDIGMCWMVHDIYDDEPLTAGETTPEAALREALKEQDGDE